MKLDRAPSTPRWISLNQDSSFPSETGEPLTMLGWGSTVPNPPYQSSDILQQAPTLYVKFEECAVAEDPATDTILGFGPDNTAVGPDWSIARRQTLLESRILVGGSFPTGLIRHRPQLSRTILGQRWRPMGQNL